MGKSSGGIRNANKPKSKISKESKEEASFAKQDILDNYSSVVNKIEKLQ